MSYDIWQDFEKMRQDLTENTHISRKALEAMLDAHKAVVAERDALAAGEYVVVHSLGEDGDKIEIDPQDWPALREAIDQLIGECQS